MGRLSADPHAEPEAYWINTSGNDLVKRFVDKADKTTQNEIERLIAGETIEKAVRLDLTYDEIDAGIDNLWSVLFTTGYLTQADRAVGGLPVSIKADRGKEICCRIAAPGNEGNYPVWYCIPGKRMYGGHG